MSRQRRKARGNGSGSVYQRKDGRWVAALTLDGRRQVRYTRSKATAEALLRRMLVDQETGQFAADERLTVGDYLARWLTTIQPLLRPRVWERYEQYCRIHVLPALGAKRLARVRPVDLQALYAERLAAGSSPSTVHHLHMVLHRALNQAVRWELLPRNPADAADPPSPKPLPAQSLSGPELRRMLDAARGDRLEALYVVAATTGMRQGELLALRWPDVDLARGVLSVRASLSRPLGQPLQFLPPKTAASQRLVQLTRLAIEALNAHHVRQEAERLAAFEWADPSLVFANRSGRPLTNQILLRQEWYPLLERAGLPRVRFHVLRHTVATQLFLAGVHPKVVQDLLGHSAITVTLGTYTHVLPANHTEAAEAMDRLLGAMDSHSAETA